MGIKRAMFPGSFDPFTKGHEAIVRKGLTLFDEVIIAIGVNSNKRSYFTLESRIEHIESLFQEKSVKLITFQGLTVDACQREQCEFILRGLRDTKDFQYERSIAHMNFSLKKIETVFLLTELSYSAINSSIVREIIINGGEIGDFVTNPEKLVHKTT
jgi:pantetheine-phosphate adenylyltransferase